MQPDNANRFFAAGVHSWAVHGGGDGDGGGGFDVEVQRCLLCGALKNENQPSKFEAQL